MSVRHIRRAALGGLLASMVLLGCHGKSTNPPDVPATSIHEEWPNEEAELLAIYLSDQLAAPRGLYDLIDNDLTTIRETWGDSIPELETIRAFPPNATSRLVLGTSDDAYAAMLDGTYTDWDSLNAVFFVGAINISQYSGGTLLRLDVRVHADSLATAYEALPGIRFARRDTYLTNSYPNIYPQLNGDDRSYLFFDTRTDHFQTPFYLHYWYFRGGTLGIQYVGYFDGVPGPDNPAPDWWAEADSCQILYQQAAREVRDSIPPATISDLQVTGVDGNSISLAWTAPGDDGFKGTATQYWIAVKEDPFADFPGSRWATGPSYSARPQTATVANLLPYTTYYIALETEDEQYNMSERSNVVTATTTAVPGWTTVHAGEGSFVSDDIRALLFNADGHLWVGTNLGVSVRDGETWTDYTPATGVFAADVLDMALDGDGNVWVATSAGLARYDGEQWNYYHRDVDGFPGEYVADLAIDPDGVVWAATAVDPALARFDGDHWTTYDSTNSGLRAPLLVRSVAFEANAAMWVATDIGYWRVENDQWETPRGAGAPLNGSIRNLFVGHSGDVFVNRFSYPSGIYLLHDGLWQFTGGPEIARGWFEDQSGTVWIGGNGAMWYDGTEWQSYQVRNSGIISDAVRAIAQGPNGDYWFGTDQGLSHYDPAIDGLVRH